MNSLLPCSFCGTINPPTECLCLNCSQPLNLWQDITSVHNMNTTTADENVVKKDKQSKLITCPNNECGAEIDSTRLKKENPKCPYCDYSLEASKTDESLKEFFLELPWGREALINTVQFGRDPETSPYATRLHPVYDNISRNHAELIFSPNKIMLRDLGSTNGTFVNETRLLPEEVITLKHGDRIRLAKKFVMLFIEYSK